MRKAGFLGWLKWIFDPYNNMIIVTFPDMIFNPSDTVTMNKTKFKVLLILD